MDNYIYEKWEHLPSLCDTAVAIFSLKRLFSVIARTRKDHQSCCKKYGFEKFMVKDVLQIEKSLIR